MLSQTEILSVLAFKQENICVAYSYTENIDFIRRWGNLKIPAESSPKKRNSFPTKNLQFEGRSSWPSPMTMMILTRPGLFADRFRISGEPEISASCFCIRTSLNLGMARCLNAGDVSHQQTPQCLLSWSIGSKSWSRQRAVRSCVARLLWRSPPFQLYPLKTTSLS